LPLTIKTILKACPRMPEENSGYNPILRRQGTCEACKQLAPKSPTSSRR